MSSTDFPISDRGTTLDSLLELAYRNNLNEISSVPRSDYFGLVRSDASRGWRIELEGTEERKNIQVHVGNRPSEALGCILPAASDST